MFMAIVVTRCDADDDDSDVTDTRRGHEKRRCARDRVDGGGEYRDDVTMVPTFDNGEDDEDEAEVKAGSEAEGEGDDG